jgi:uncharacterized membrane protein YbaN (DUF454 family)
VLNNWKKRLLIIVGTTSTAIGMVGIFIPVLPTTPFLLLAAACYIRSSQKLYRWLLNNKFFVAYLKDYLEGKGMALKIKIITVILLWTSISLSIIFVIESSIVKGVFVLLAIGVSIHLALTKTVIKPKEERK